MNLTWLWEPRRFRIINIQAKKYLGKSPELADIKPCLYSSVYLKSPLLLVNGSASPCPPPGASKMGRGNLPWARSECRLDLKLWQAFRHSFLQRTFPWFFFFFFNAGEIYPYIKKLTDSYTCVLAITHNTERATREKAELPHNSIRYWLVQLLNSCLRDQIEFLPQHCGSVHRNYSFLLYIFSPSEKEILLIL